MATLVSPGVSVTIIDNSFYVPASAPTVPLIFLATRADKKQPDGVTPATGVSESGVVRTITSISTSTTMYGVPYFRTDTSGNQLHGDARNEYGLFALNQFLSQGNVAYVVRADVDLADADATTLVGGTPAFSGAGNGTLTGFTVNQATAQAEVWTITCTSPAAWAASHAYTAGNTINVNGNVYTCTTSGTSALANSNVAWAATTAYTLNEIINVAGVAYKCTVAGTSGSTAPTWPGSGTVTDGTVTWTFVGANTVFPNSPSTSTIYADGTASWQYTPSAAAIFSVSGFASGPQPNAAYTGSLYNNGLISFTINNGNVPFAAGDTFQVVITSQTVSNPLGNNDAAKRVTITTALNAQINGNQDVRSDLYEYNLILCPGYPECVSELSALNDSINDEAFIIADVPNNLAPEDVATWALTNARVSDNSVAYYFPNCMSTNLDGSSVFVAASGTALYVYAYSDNVAEVWFPPAGPRRGLTSNIQDIGYVMGTLGTATTFTSTPLNQGQRDVLYQTPNSINPIPYFPGSGIMVFGQKTSQSVASALDRVNVMRLVTKIKRDLRKAAFAYLFELNDDQTRSSFSQMVTSYLNDIMVRRGLYDFVVLCDESNNTSTVIDGNELVCQVAISPERAIEFIYIPITVDSAGDTTIVNN